MKKVVLFLDHSEVLGGSQLVLTSYLKHFSKRDFKCIAACSAANKFPINKFSEYAKVYVIRFSRLKRFSFGVLNSFVHSVFDVIRIVEKERVDIIAANTERAFYVAVAASFFKKLKLVLFIRDYCYNKLLIKLLASRVDKIFCVSEDIKAFYGVEGDVIFVSSDILERAGKTGLAKVQAFRLGHDLQDKYVIGYAGRLVEWKGIRWLLYAVDGLTSKDIVCVIAGDLKDLPSDLLPYTKNKKFRFVGFVEDIEIFYKCLNVFVHPASEKEPFATTLVESQMCKVPVVATCIGGNLEIVENEVTGILVKPRSSRSIAEAIVRLKDDKSLSSKIAANAFEQVRERHSIGREVSYLQGCFELL